MQEENIDYEDLYQASFEDIKEEINIDAKTTDEGYKINKVKCKNDINSKLYVGQIIKKVISYVVIGKKIQLRQGIS